MKLFGFPILKFTSKTFLPAAERRHPDFGILSRPDPEFSHIFSDPYLDLILDFSNPPLLDRSEGV